MPRRNPSALPAIVICGLVAAAAVVVVILVAKSDKPQEAAIDPGPTAAAEGKQSTAGKVSKIRPTNNEPAKPAKSKEDAVADPDDKGTPTEAEPSEPPREFDALALWEEYGANELRADNNFKGKRVILRGPSVKVSRDAKGYFAGFAVTALPALSPAALQRLTPREREWYSKGVPPGVRCYLAPGKEKPFAEAVLPSPIRILGQVKGVERTDEAFQGYVLILELCELAPAK